MALAVPETHESEVGEEPAGSGELVQVPVAGAWDVKSSLFSATTAQNCAVVHETPMSRSDGSSTERDQLDGVVGNVEAAASPTVSTARHRAVPAQLSEVIGCPEGGATWTHVTPVCPTWVPSKTAPSTLPARHVPADGQLNALKAGEGVVGESPGTGEVDQASLGPVARALAATGADALRTITAKAVTAAPIVIRRIWDPDAIFLFTRSTVE